MSKAENRDLRLDALRGILLVVMAMDHFPTMLFNLTYECLGYVTAAEGFVFLSGLVAGRVYSRYRENESSQMLWKRACLRTGFIYSFHITVFAFLFALVVLFGLKTSYTETWTSAFYERPAQALLTGVALLYQPRLFDILPMYCVFVLAVPCAIEFFRRRRPLFILAASGTVWATAQFGILEHLQQFLSRFFPVSFGAFDPLAWQFLFMLGVCAGAAIYSSSKPKRWKHLTIVSSVAVILFFLIRHGWMGTEPFAYRVESLAQIGILGPVRLLNFCAVAFLISQTCKRPLNNGIFKALALLGRHSIEVFAFHILQVYFFYGVFRDASLKELWLLPVIATLFLPAWFFEKHRNPWKAWFSFRPGGLVPAGDSGDMRAAVKRL